MASSPRTARAGRRLTPDERELIIELKLSRTPVLAIAHRLSCSTTTVQAVWKKYLAERVSERKKANDLALEETIVRLDKNATDARQGFITAVRDDELSSASKFLEAERKALTELAKFGAVRDGEPTQAAKVTEAQAKALASAIRTALDTSGLPVDQRAVVLGAVVSSLRQLGA